MIEKTLFLSSFGWSILHSIWQIVLLGAALRIVLSLTPKAQPQVRFNASLAALACIPIFFGITWYSIYSAESPLANPNGTFSTNLQELSDKPSPTTLYPVPVMDSTSQKLLGKTRNMLQGNIHLLTLAWFAGFILFALRLGGSYFYLQRLKKQHALPLSEHWQSIVQKVRSRMLIKKSVHLMESARIHIPMVVGHIKPVIILPLGLVSRIPCDQLEAILAHELAHIRRNDFIINLFRACLEAIFFYHPAFWWISRVMDEAREHCCDDATISYCGSPRPLQKALLDLSEYNQKPQPIAAALYKNTHQLLKRIKRMKTKNQKNHGIRLNVQLPFVLLIALMAVVVGSSWTPYQHSKIKGIVQVEKQEPPEAIAQLETPQHPKDPVQMGPIRSLPPDSVKTTATSPEKGVISLEMDENGNLISVRKDGMELSGTEREKYENLTQKVLALEEKEAAMEENEQKLEELEHHLDEVSSKMQEIQREYQQAMQEYVALRNELNIAGQKGTWSLFEKDFFDTGQFAEAYARQQELAGIFSDPSHFNDAYTSDLFDDLENQSHLWNEHFEDPESYVRDILEMQERNRELQESFLLERDRELQHLEELLQIEQHFEHSIREELKRDGLLKDDAPLNFQLSAKRLVVNGRKQDAVLHEKYLNMYQEFNKHPLEKDTHVVIQD